MSSESQGSNFALCGKPNRDRTRRGWSVREEKALLAALKELAQTWTCSTGFRAGYMILLEKAIRKEFPGTDLRGNPNIQSKLNVWKKDYKSLKAILSQRGVRFNLKGDHMIHCDNVQWEKIVKNDGNARLMRFKSWPYWEDWNEIFGKAKTNGSNGKFFWETFNKFYDQENVLPEICGKDKTNRSNAEDVEEVFNKLYAKEDVLPEICGKDKTNGSNVEDVEEAFNKLYAKEDVLPEICGKDKTNGSNAEDVEEAVSKSYADENVLPENCGNDKTKGSNAEDVEEAVSKPYAQENVGKISAGPDYNKTEENMSPSDAAGDNGQGGKATQTALQAAKDSVSQGLKATQAAEDSVFQGQKTTQTAMQTGRKRKAVDGMDGPLDMLKKLHQDKNAILDKLSTPLAYESDLFKARKGVYGIVSNIPGLTLNVRFDVCELLLEKAHRLDIFMGLPEAVRPEYVMWLLNRK
ncbi:uncharacterized protein LOC125204982 [Salvia hispanica]|uniref:uncharacterized protein LOC125204982 n=1 Tax=Salvia hispanica TaxID=49212 RepID=UPI002009232A|nr:uncharacterized protein LOC125204982 [Salvia hispanica]